MDSSSSSARPAAGGGGPPRPSPRSREVQLQGPRPSPLKVKKDSHKITKKPSQPPPQPVVIYAVSPKVIHADTSNFMAIVQRLTGLTSDENSGNVSPAARMAAIEKASSTSPEKSRSDMVEVSRVSGVLSPAPENLPPVSQGFFSQAAGGGDDDLMTSPFWFGSSCFTPSPSTGLLSASIVSPGNSYDLFSQFWDL